MVAFVQNDKLGWVDRGVQLRLELKNDSFGRDRLTLIELGLAFDGLKARKKCWIGHSVNIAC